MSLRNKILITVAFLFGVFVFSSSADAATFYVATNGNDGNSCATAQNISTPKRTLNNVVGCLTPGSTLYIRTGTYPEMLWANIPSGTSWNSPVTLAAYPGETVTLNPTAERVLQFQNNQQYIIIDRLILDGAHINRDVIKITYGSDPNTNAHHIRIQNSEIKNAPDNGILGGGGQDGNEYINNNVHHNGFLDPNNHSLRHGFYLGNPKNVTIRGNYVHDNSAFGIQIQYDGGINTVVEGNWIDRNQGGGMVIFSDQANIVVKNNIFTRNAGEGILYGRAADAGSNSSWASTPAKFYNNTFYNTGVGISIATNPQPWPYGHAINTQIRNNIFWQNSNMVELGPSEGTIMDHNLTIDPKFVNAAANDFHLQSSSPAINTGATISEVPTDKDGVTRPVGSAYDIGAYEYGGTVGPTPTPSPIPTPLSTQFVYPSDTTMTHLSMPALSEPPLANGNPIGNAVTMPNFGTKVIRVSNYRHHYAKDQPWNADQTKIRLQWQQILDGNTYADLATLSNLPNEHSTWSNTNPNLIYGVQTPNQWTVADIRTNTRTVLHTFTEYDSVSYGGYEGNMDNNDKYVSLMASKGSANYVALVNAQTGVKKCEVNTGTRPDNSQMSQDGNFMIIHHSLGNGLYRYSVYDTNCSFLRNLEDNQGSHFDVCVDTNGDQVAVAASNHPMPMYRLSDGRKTYVYDDNTMRIHVSCRNINRPGWAIISGADGDPDAGENLYNRVFAVKLTPTNYTASSPVIENFAWEHTPQSTDYDGAPMGVPSRDGYRVMWKARWDSQSNPVHTYVAFALGTTLTSTPTPSTSSGPTPMASATPSPSTLKGDLNNDKIVNSLDWSIMNSKWFTSDSTADLNNDGIVNSLDFSIMNGNWLRGE